MWSNTSSYLLRIVSTVLLLVWIVNGWEDDYHYFTSFRDVNEWPKMYAQCNDSNLDNRHHLSPLPLPKSSKAKAREKGSRVLWIYNHKAPPKDSYAVQYGFPKNKECIQSSFFNPCFISRSLGLVRAVVLSAERERLTEVRRNFKIQQPEKFVTLVTGIEGVTEKKFYEAVFVGSTDCRKSKQKGRSTHTVDGKSYPMEIYMYFVDESLPVMQQTVVLVVFVEEQEDDNEQVEPVVKAIRNHLVKEERQSLYDLIKNSSFGRERTFHHMAETVTTMNVDSTVTFKKLNSSNELFQQYIDRQEQWEKILTFSDETQTDDDQKAATISWMVKKSKLLQLPFLATESDAAATANYQYWLYPAVYRSLGFDAETLGATLSYNSSKIEGYEFNPILKRMSIAVEPGDEASLQENVKELMNLLLKASDDAAGPSKPDEKKDCKLGSAEIQDMKEVFVKEKADEEKIEVTFVKVADGLSKLTRGSFTYEIDGKRDSATFDTQKYLVEQDISSLQQLLNFKAYAETIDTRLDELAKKAGFVDYTAADSVVKKELSSRKEFFYAEEADEDTIHEYNEWTFKKIGSVQGGNFGMSHEEFKRFYDTSPIKSYVQSAFQISWLIPSDGGYYIYKGSSPVPPCFEAEHVLVFKKPIKMSKEQIRVLTTIPTTHHKDADITSTLTPFHKFHEGAPDITFEKRKHLFLHNDGIHKSAIKVESKKSSANAVRHLFLLNLIAYSLFLFKLHA